MKTSIKKVLIAICVVLLIFMAKYWYLSPKFREGQNIPTFTANLSDGRQFNLSDLRGKFVLLQFWGSWCGPCRRENPQLVQLYSEMKDKNLEIVSIALEQNPDSWQKAIASDGLSWPYQILQQGGFEGPLAKLYAVRQIPTLYLLGPDQKVILTNPTPLEVKNHVLTNI